MATIMPIDRNGLGLRRHLRRCIGVVLVAGSLWGPLGTVSHAELPWVDDVSRRHLAENSDQIVRALELLGSPIGDKDRARLQAAARQPDDVAIGTIQEVLDSYCLLGVHIDEEGWLKVRQAAADPDTRRLAQHEWRTFLVKVHNLGSVTTPLQVQSRQAFQHDEITRAGTSPQNEAEDPDSWFRWLALKMFQDPPVRKTLSGQQLDYIILQLYSRDAGIRAVDLVFYLGGGPVARGHYADTSILFHINGAEPTESNCQ